MTPPQSTSAKVREILSATGSAMYGLWSLGLAEIIQRGLGHPVVELIYICFMILFFCLPLIAGTTGRDMKIAIGFCLGFAIVDTIYIWLMSGWQGSFDYPAFHLVLLALFCFAVYVKLAAIRGRDLRNRQHDGTTGSDDKS